MHRSPGEIRLYFKIGEKTRNVQNFISNILRATEPIMLIMNKWIEIRIRFLWQLTLQ